MVIDGGTAGLQAGWGELMTRTLTSTALPAD
jgi:hypothetical protein